MQAARAVLAELPARQGKARRAYVSYAALDRLERALPTGASAQAPSAALLAEHPRITEALEAFHLACAAAATGGSSAKAAEANRALVTAITDALAQARKEAWLT